MFLKALKVRPLRLLCLAPLLAGGCSVFEDYPAAAAGAVEAFQSGDFNGAAQQFGELEGALDSNQFLALAEQGMAWHVGGELERATDAWLRALAVLDGFADRPTISGRSASEATLSMVVNDKAMPYDGETFEVCLLHAFLAWDYLRLGSLDDAMVEVLRGYALQQREEERFAKTYGMNRLARFVAAVAQELDGAYDEALMDLERLHRDVPDNQAVAAALARVRALDAAPYSAPERRQAEIVVVYEQGRMPAKVEEGFTYPGRRTFGRFAVPAYRAAYVEPGQLELLVDGGARGRTEVLESVAAVAYDNLHDRVGWVTAKAAVRTAAKTIVIDQVADEIAEERGDGTGLAFGLLAGLLSSWTESADLRSWLTLPAAVQVLRLPLEPGTYALAARLGSGDSVALGTWELRPGQKVFVAARSLRGRLYATASGAQSVPSAAPAAP